MVFDANFEDHIVQKVTSTCYNKDACVFTSILVVRGQVKEVDVQVGPTLAPMLESSLTYNIYITVDLLCVDAGRAMPPLGL
jgi:hypothetical protein